MPDNTVGPGPATAPAGSPPPAGAGVPPPRSTLADQLLQLLADRQVDYVFTCPGSTEAAILDASLGTSAPELVLTTHEAIAVSMADGYARVSGAPAVAYLHANVGLANGIAHLAAAALARSPVVVLSGLKHSALHGRRGFTTSPAIRDHVRQYVKWDWQTLRSDCLLEDVGRAVSVATHEPAGPTWVGITEDVIEGHSQTDPPVRRGRGSPPLSQPAEVDLDAAADALRSAARPLIVAGSDVGRRHASRLLLQLAEQLDAPVMREGVHALERVVIPTGHPRYAGAFVVGSPALQAADVVLFVGARCVVEFEPVPHPVISDRTTLVFAHPDPVEVAGTEGVDIALVGDVAHTLGALIERTDPGDGIPTSRRAYCADVCVPTQPSPPPEDGDPLGVATIGRLLATVLEDDAIVVSDATTARNGLMEAIPKPIQLHASSSGSLGWGVGAALGASLAAPGRRVLCLLGDGVFQFGLPGLATAAKRDLAVTFLIVNNQRYAAVAKALRRHGGRAEELADADLPGTDIGGPHLARIADGFGISSRRVDDVRGLREALDEATSATGPRVIEAMTT